MFPINYRNNGNQSPSLLNEHINNQVSFGTTRKVQIVNKIVTNAQYTDFFRHDMNWEDLINHISNNFKQGKVHIFNFACSDGSEPYSLAMGLMAKDKNSAQRFFPIKAIDISKVTIEKAKRYVIGLRKSVDIPLIKRHLKQAGMTFEEFFSRDKKEPCEIFTRYKIKMGQYSVSSRLKKAVKFKNGDIVKLVKNRFPDNTVILFRNAWPYLTPEQAQKTVENLYKNLPSGGLVICGAFDQNHSNACELLLKQGFKPLDKLKPVIINDRYSVKRKIVGEVNFKTQAPVYGIYQKP